MVLSADDRRIVAAIAGDILESLTPFEDLSRRLGVTEEELLGAIERFRREGMLRRFGAVVRPWELGFAANAMAVWRIEEERAEEAAKVIASYPAVSHCYLRESRQSWPYNLYAMIHGRTRDDCQRIAAKISRSIGSEENRLLFSVREFKKSSPVYFRSRQEG
jgi:DNA-binding Lrp family transcriptional regulator